MQRSGRGHAHPLPNRRKADPTRTGAGRASGTAGSSGPIGAPTREACLGRAHCPGGDGRESVAILRTAAPRESTTADTPAPSRTRSLVPPVRSCHPHLTTGLPNGARRMPTVTEGPWARRVQLSTRGRASAPTRVPAAIRGSEQGAGWLAAAETRRCSTRHAFLLRRAGPSRRTLWVEPPSQRPERRWAIAFGVYTVSGHAGGNTRSKEKTWTTLQMIEATESSSASMRGAP